MDIARLKEYIKDMPDDARIIIHDWTDNGSEFYHAERAVNDGWQKEKNVLLLYATTLDHNL